MILTQVKKISGAIGYIFFWQTLLHCQYKQNTSFKNFHIYFSYAFLGGSPSQVLAGTKSFREVIQPQRLQYAVQEPQNLVLSSFSCPHQDTTLTGQVHASVVTQKSVINRSKTLKSVKIRYIRYNKKSVLSIFSQIDFQSTRCVPVISRP